MVYEGKFRRTGNSLIYATDNDNGIFETSLTKRGKEYIVKAENCDLEYAGAEPDYCETFKKSKLAIADFVEKCTQQAEAAGISCPNLEGKAAYYNAVLFSGKNSKARQF